MPTPKALLIPKTPPAMNMKNLLSYFLNGLLYLVPVAVTIYVLVAVVSFADSIFAGIPIVGQIPGMGLVLVLILITLAGYFGNRLVTPQLVSWFNRNISKVPLIKLIYTSVRDLMKAFVGEKRKFNKPVLVKLDPEGYSNRFGFITQEDLSSLGLDGMISVYSPYPYSMMGDLIIVPAKNVTLIDVKPADLMKMIVSGGVSLPGEKADDEFGEEEKK